MAIVIEEHSRCPLCDTVLNSSKEYLMTPPLISNTLDQLFILSDAGIHVDCLNNSKLKDKLLHHLASYNNRMPPSQIRCSIDNQLMQDPRDLLTFGLLTSDESESLFQYNFLSFNKRNIHKWESRLAFISTAEQFLLEGKWQGLGDFNYLSYMLDKVKSNS